MGNYMNGKVVLCSILYIFNEKEEEYDRPWRFRASCDDNSTFFHRMVASLVRQLVRQLPRLFLLLLLPLLRLFCRFVLEESGELPRFHLLIDVPSEHFEVEFRVL